MASEIVSVHHKVGRQVGARDAPLKYCNTSMEWRGWMGGAKKGDLAVSRFEGHGVQRQYAGCMVEASV